MDTPPRDPLVDAVLAAVEANRREAVALIAADRREVELLVSSLKDVGEAHRAGDKEAVTKAFAAAGELANSHNDLLRKMERLADTFATKETVEKRFGRIEAWQAKVAGGLLVVAAIGVANFVKVWTG